jgi:dihydrofolate synthase/folylpolyglutamate synthase
MSIAGRPNADAELDEMLYAVSLVEQSMGIDPSYFEILTGAAFRWFADEAVDIAVVEVGMGGQWDATNVIDARVAVVTNVAVDHVEYLGTTRAEIAADKAGIVRPDATLVLGETDPKLQSFFEARQPASIMRRDVDFGVRRNVLAVGGRLVDLYADGEEYRDVFLALHGAHQADNAAVAVAAASACVNTALPYDVVEEALRRVESPGRLEVVSRQPLTLLDGAHNVAGAEALRRALAEEFDEGPRSMVVGLLREKEPHEMLAALDVASIAGVLIACRPPSPRAQAPTLVAQAAVDLGLPPERVEVVDDIGEALAAALLATPPDGQIVVTGSLYTVGAARSVLL